MPIATPEVYADMLDRAKAGSFAYPAINVTSSQTLNAAIRGFAEAGSDGIVQISTGGADYLCGSTIKNMVSGSIALAAYANEVAKNFDVNIALHTDHCPKGKLDGFVRPLIAASTERVKTVGLPWFQSHMWDGSVIPVPENLTIARELLDLCQAAHIILEIEVGAVGGEEDPLVGAFQCLGAFGKGGGKGFRPLAHGQQLGLETIAFAHQEQRPDEFVSGGTAAAPRIDQHRQALARGCQQVHLGFVQRALAQQGRPEMGLQEDPASRREQHLDRPTDAFAGGEPGQPGQFRVGEQRSPHGITDQDGAGDLVE